MNGLQKWDLVALIDVWDESPAGSSSNLRVSLVEQVGFMGLWVYGFMGLWVYGLVMCWLISWGRIYFQSWRRLG
jgi:hypothetical protein